MLFLIKTIFRVIDNTKYSDICFYLLKYSFLFISYYICQLTLFFFTSKKQQNQTTNNFHSISSFSSSTIICDTGFFLENRKHFSIFACISESNASQKAKHTAKKFENRIIFSLSHSQCKEVFNSTERYQSFALPVQMLYLKLCLRPNFKA